MEFQLTLRVTACPYGPVRLTRERYFTTDTRFKSETNRQAEI